MSTFSILDSIIRNARFPRIQIVGRYIRIPSVSNKSRLKSFIAWKNRDKSMWVGLILLKMKQFHRRFIIFILESNDKLFPSNFLVEKNDYIIR